MSACKPKTSESWEALFSWHTNVPALSVLPYSYSYATQCTWKICQVYGSITVNPDAILVLAERIRAAAHVRAEIVLLQTAYGQIHLPRERVQRALGDYVLGPVVQFHIA